MPRPRRDSARPHRLSVARLAAPIALALLLSVVGCNSSTKSANSNAPLPIVNASPVPQPDENILALKVTLSGGKFDADTYTQLPGATRLIVDTQDGPYTFSIDRLVDPRELPASGSTVILFNVTDPGRYTMHASRNGQQTTATLEIGRAHV